MLKLSISASLSLALVMGCGGYDGYALRGDSQVAPMASGSSLLLAQSSPPPQAVTPMESPQPPPATHVYDPVRHNKAKTLLITGGVFTIIAIGGIVGGASWAAAECAHSSSSFCSLGGGATAGFIGATHLPIGVVLLGVGGYRYTH